MREVEGVPEQNTSADPARIAAARREVEAFAREQGASVVEESVGCWRIERAPRRFQLGIDFWTAEVRADGGLSFSRRDWRPDPRP